MMTVPDEEAYEKDSGIKIPGGEYFTEKSKEEIPDEISERDKRNKALIEGLMRDAEELRRKEYQQKQSDRQSCCCR